jgi:hypothetical protein
MSHPTDPTRSDASGIVHATHHEIRRRGRLFGLEYDVGIRVPELSDPEMEPSRPPLLPRPPRPVLPGTPERTEAEALEGIGRWESEGGK